MPSTNAGEHGFSLVELLNVVLIIGILVTMAAPGLVRTRDRAHDAVATADLQTAAKAAARVQREVGMYPQVPHVAVTALQGEERNLEFLARVRSEVNQSQGPRQITVEIDDASMISICNQSRSGRFYCYREDQRGLLLTADVVNRSGSDAGDDDGTVIAASMTGPMSGGAARGDDGSSRYASRSTGATEWDARCALRRRAEGYQAQDLNNDGVFETWTTPFCGSGRQGWTSIVDETTSTTPPAVEIVDAVDTPADADNRETTVVCAPTGDTDPSNAIPDFASRVVLTSELAFHVTQGASEGACDESSGPIGVGEGEVIVVEESAPGDQSEDEGEEPIVPDTPLTEAEQQILADSHCGDLMLLNITIASDLLNKLCICRFVADVVEPFETLIIDRDDYLTYLTNGGAYLGACTGDEVPPAPLGTSTSGSGDPTTIIPLPVPLPPPSTLPDPGTITGGTVIQLPF